MEWMTAIDLYCERTSAAFWAEPFNALSNLAFLLAAIWGYRAAAARQVLSWPLGLALLLTTSVGIGSFLFHTFANSWSELTDVQPDRVFRIAVIAMAVTVALLWLVSVGVITDEQQATGDDFLNGSGQYAPAVIAVYVFAAVMMWRGNPQKLWILGGAVAFTVSLVMRTIDLRVCDGFPVGTHMFWHLLNGLMVALLLQALIRQIAAPAPLMRNAGG